MRWLPLFNNVSITPSNGPGPPGCDDVVDKEADARTVRAGGLIGYRITARNRGILAVTATSRSAIAFPVARDS